MLLNVKFCLPLYRMGPKESNIRNHFLPCKVIQEFKIKGNIINNQGIT